MKRKDFLAKASLGTVVFCTGMCFSGCEKDDLSPKQVDFTIDINQDPYKDLQNIDGSYTLDNVIMVRIDAKTIVAFDKSCTHQATTIGYSAPQKVFVCPNHGSKFNTEGVAVVGPANRALYQYNADLNGFSLHVYNS